MFNHTLFRIIVVNVVAAAAFVVLAVTLQGLSRDVNFVKLKEFTHFKTYVFWDVTLCRLVNITDISNDLTAFKFRVKQSKEKKGTGDYYYYYYYHHHHLLYAGYLYLYS